MFTEKTLRQFTEELASGAPVPGGGSAAALVGSTAAGLVSMVCNLTVGREKYRDVETEMQQLLAQSEALRKEMLDLLEADTQVYSQVMAAYRLPRGTDEEKKKRTAAIQQALKDACGVPMGIARASVRIAQLCVPVTDKGNVGAVSDAGVGVILAVATFDSAILNVDINLASIKDEAFATALRQEIAQLRSVAVATREQVLGGVQGKLGG